ncbi:MAG: gephyrin-like molybdotransferase Glp [Candidatus Eisenbacteria bacterium]
MATGDAKPDPVPARSPDSPARRFVPFDEARATILARAASLLMPTEFVPIDEALGRTLRENLVASEPSPRFANSAMDGFAVRSVDVASAGPDAPVSLRVVETVPAGRVATLTIGKGEAIRLMTGAAMPEGADAVLPVEQTVGGQAPVVQALASVAAGEHVRAAGEDFAAGTVLVSPGRVIDPSVIGILATLGHPDAEVSMLPRVAVISTGDELVAPGAALGPGQIHDSNTHTIRAMIRAAGCEPGPCWHVLDDAEAVATAIGRVAEHCEAIITLGGVSAGDFDPVKQALPALGDVELWRVGMRPGQPQAFGTVRGKLFFGLPGNPVSSAVVFEMLVRPALWTLLGRSVLDRPSVRAVLGDAVVSKVGRRDFLRVTLEELSPEESLALGVAYRARLTGTQSSGAFSSVLTADGLAMVPDDKPAADRGEVLTVASTFLPRGVHPRGPSK